MGIYLGQLPPAEIARLKAELAETLITHFCYPRFFDYRTDSLQMRPVDRVKRQEVWLYLSSFDFTAWNRVDLMSADLQNQIELLFIQFVQRNRSFFGNQGRRRMSDIRTQIGSCATSVSQRLRNHLSGQKQMAPPFGSPRPVVTWSTTSISNRPEPSWEQISASTMALQQQLQEWRGEIRTGAANDTRTASPTGPLGNGVPRRPTRPQPTPAQQSYEKLVQQPTLPTAPVNPRPGVAPATVNGRSAASGAPQTAPAAQPSEPARRYEVPLQPVQPVEPLARRTDSVPPRPAEQPSARLADPALTARRTESAPQPIVSPTQAPSGVLPQRPSVRPSTPESPSPSVSHGTSPNISNVQAATANVTTATTAAGQREMLTVGEDDMAIFEQLRHQLVLWLRVEALTAGLETTNQAPAQLLDLLRQQSRLDETRLQVVSTLLNLSNQVMKTGVVSVLDYKQALMFHLMHTKR
ncbi:hypothetical protein [Tengunoibacter tsumagoiensis]|uniref:Uncharacterized protein n=1 Tax=Tengunoibacter tsumagoiensis TaxID=2014871 RepID=A0A401ZY86_9CHLR|nr:hypothetical protein [Tengunoibacter tsumagoiensis]GCE11824.1 hypothetical protein KTT_16830 [Tengunoibacter tsumagoiensis]